MTVYKYRCRVREAAFSIELPTNSHVLSVQVQDGVPHIWVINSPHLPHEVRWFRWYGTGHDIDVTESPIYVGTVQRDGFVWHLFEVKPAGAVRSPHGNRASGEIETPVDFNDERIK